MAIKSKLLSCSLLLQALLPSIGAFAQGNDNQIPLGLGDIFGPNDNGKRPNVLFILTDDQDLHMNSLDYLPLIRKHLINEGTLFKKHFCTTAICCPARVTLWTGKAAHNTNVTDVSPLTVRLTHESLKHTLSQTFPSNIYPTGGYPKFVSQGLNDRYLPVFLQDLGYNTYYAGKLYNEHNQWNYNNPYPAGWTGSDFLLDPYTYMYLNATFQRNRDPQELRGPVQHRRARGQSPGLPRRRRRRGQALLPRRGPVAPHSNVNLGALPESNGSVALPIDGEDASAYFSPPIPAERHAHLFPDAVVPRRANFNPDSPSGANWIRQQPKLSQENVEWNDHYYRSRLRALQAVDELVDSVVNKLDAYGVLDNTYIFYTTDNGFHISYHRLQPGKECGFEEDINIPLIIRGPGVPKGKVSEIHPLTEEGLEEATKTRHDHVTVEFWGIAASEGKYGYFGSNISFITNNTYKAIRVVSKEYNLYYSVWCTNEHELYNLNTDPGQLNNLLDPEAAATTLFGKPLTKVVARLDALLLVTKSCKGVTCARPWQTLHPQGNEQAKVSYSKCEMGYIVESEGAQFETDGVVYKHGTSWSEWV
ncbi:unnamed protein product [Parascedosporium putredinis]|uniref:Arylsulfatase n=1 Tax=Parascedosporium putredinis TaxID=1442378 RepID=A0A9P1GYP3_9PEZI|nr:unnamed protein product [Parascedosporium putredinis]CAI7990170.1 unnamed protein product [Parascedosporium putredinis]